MKDENLLNALDAALIEMAKLEEQRNALVHSCWLESKPDETLNRLKITAKEGKGWKHGIHEVTVEEVNGLADKIRDLDMALTLLGAKLSEWRDGASGKSCSSGKQGE